MLRVWICKGRIDRKLGMASTLDRASPGLPKAHGTPWCCSLPRVMSVNGAEWIIVQTWPCSRIPESSSVEFVSFVNLTYSVICDRLVVFYSVVFESSMNYEKSAFFL